MSRNDQIQQIIYDAIVTTNETLPRGRRLDLSPDTVIIGESGKLDSIGLVNFIAYVEEGIERKFHQTLSVIDLVMSESDAWTVAGVTDWLAEQIDALAPEMQRAAGPPRA